MAKGNELRTRPIVKREAERGRPAKMENAPNYAAQRKAKGEGSHKRKGDK